MAQHFGLQPGQPVAQTGSSSRHLRLVPDQPAAAFGEDGRTTGKACAVLLDDAGGRTPDANPVLGDAAQHCAFAASGKLIGRRQRRQTESRRAKEDG